VYRGQAKGQLGTGVDVNAIVRLRDRFLDLQYRNENRFLGEWTVKQNTYEKLEVIFNEIRATDDGFGTGLNRVFNEFWNAWQDLSRDPEKLEAKVAVVHRGVALAEAFNTLGRQLQTFENDLISQTAKKVEQANVLLSQIAELNKQIVKIHAMGQNANDLMDRRDLLVDELSGLINIEVEEDDLGGYKILLSGTNHELVSANGKQFDEFVFEDESLSLKSLGTTGTPLYTIGDQNTDLSGEILGYLQSIEKVQEYHEQINVLVVGFVKVINEKYEGLFTYNNFEKAAIELSFNENLIQNPDDLKAGTSGLSGDGDLAREIAQLRDELIEFDTANGPINATIADFYNGIVGQLGIESQEAQRRVENHGLLVFQTEMLRQSVSGVSLDEEMANLVMFQHAYNAAARSLTVMDEMLDKLINGTGIVGR